MRDPIALLGRATRALARARGMRALLDPWLGSLGIGHREIEMRDFDGDLHLRLRLYEHMESRIFWYGSYSRDVLCVLERMLNPGDIIIDVGANIGEIAMFCSKRVGAMGKIVAVEPLQATATRLHAHARINRITNIEVVECAVGERIGTATLFGHDGRLSDGLQHSGLTTAFRSSERDAALAEVPMTTLDALVASRGISRVNGLKMDIEGGELAALIGADTLLRRMRPWIVLEANHDTCRAAGYHPEDLLRHLTELNYTFALIGRRGVLSAIDADKLRRFQNVLCTPIGSAHG